MGERKQTLCRLLDKNREEYHCLYSNNVFHNHLPHGLIALYGLGADSKRLGKHYASYQGELPHAIPSTKTINSSNWKEHLGKKKYFLDYFEYFDEEMSKKGVSHVLDEVLPSLTSGMHGGLLHGVIQLGFSLYIDYQKSIADGLAFWAFLNKPLNRKLGIGKEEPPIQILQELRNDIQGKKNISLEDYDLKVERVASHTEVDHLFELMMRTTIELFEGTGYNDFFLLHGITSCFALREIAGRVSSLSWKVEAIRYFWQAIVDLYFQQHAPKIIFPNESSPILHHHVQEKWNSIIQDTLKQEDDHLLKVVFILHHESLKHRKSTEGQDEERLYSRVAEQALKVISSSGYVHDREAQ